ncbi:hypothetical protein [Acidisoma sp. 7E03]
MSTKPDLPPPSPRFAEARDAEAVRRHLFDACEQAGGMRAWSRRTGVPVSLVSETLSGRRDPDVTIANALGLIALTAFVPARQAALPAPVSSAEAMS